MKVNLLSDSAALQLKFILIITFSSLAVMKFFSIFNFGKDTYYWISRLLKNYSKLSFLFGFEQYFLFTSISRLQVSYDDCTKLVHLFLQGSQKPDQSLI